MKLVSSCVSRMGHHALGMFILRAVIGGIFIYAGYYKLAHMDQAIAGFATMGFGAFWAWLVAIIEFFGGIAFVLGIMTRITGYLFAIIMAVVIFKVKWATGFMSYQGDLALLAGSLAVALCGCGRWSIARMAHGSCGSCGDKGAGCNCAQK